MTAAADTRIVLLVTARAMVHAVHSHELPVEGGLSWKIRPITVDGGVDGPLAGLWADMLVKSPAGWECGVAAVLGVSGWPQPAVGKDYDEQERREIGEQLTPKYQHALWDHAAMAARVQSGLVHAGLQIPMLTPDYELVFDDPDAPPADESSDEPIK